MAGVTAARAFLFGYRALNGAASSTSRLTAAATGHQQCAYGALAGRVAAVSGACTSSPTRRALGDALLLPVQSTSWCHWQQLPKSGASILALQLLAQGGHRGLFGRAEQAQKTGDVPSGLELPNIGGEGGYFDHDESHEGLAHREMIASLFDDWNEALATKDPEQVANLYAHDAVLLPTVSNEVRTTRAGIVDYFTSFLKLSPQGKVDQSQIRLLSPSLALHSGVYSFTLEDEGKVKIVQARFTFLYKQVNGQWKITEHHSSAMPEVQPAGVAEMFDRWNTALQTGNPEVVADLYAPDGVLLPTVSNQVRTCRQGIVDYFTNFLQLKPYGTIDKCIIRELAPDVAINSGIYTFKLTRPTGVEDVKARYTFIYRKIDDKWFIAEHHSSAMPEK